MSSIYVVTWTSFYDDYKLRGNDPSTSLEPALFSKLEYAKEYLASLLRDYLEVCEYEDEYIKETFPECLDEDGNIIKHKNRYGYETVSYESLDCDTLQRMVYRVNEGEFVPKSLEWDILETELDTMRVKSSKKKSKK